MRNLMYKWSANKTVTNANAILKYAAKTPMWQVSASGDMIALYGQIRALAV